YAPTSTIDTAKITIATAGTGPAASPARYMRTVSSRPRAARIRPPARMSSPPPGTNAYQLMGSSTGSTTEAPTTCAVTIGRSAVAPNQPTVRVLRVVGGAVGSSGCRSRSTTFTVMGHSLSDRGAGIHRVSPRPHPDLPGGQPPERRDSAVPLAP